ncbi:MAG: hypothetical protein TU35_005350 [Thermoproteus sp. AZ2]|jgi:hypothetical protein|uniref:Uncharacterized protein n=1 Tax=Thermoproteus sp. AZ2 TaxID=1609232 RepID=A0ACC6V154_9CREN|nr:MAG: hypothetical protein TU35_04465 [Thermoproteus sp. AZ2]
MDFVDRAVARFKELFGAEAEVEVLKASEDSVVVKFGGNMCYTCGAYDYFEDFAYMLSDEAPEDWGVASYTQTEEGEYVVEFKPRRLIGRARRHVKIVLDGRPLDLTL